MARGRHIVVTKGNYESGEQDQPGICIMCGLETNDTVFSHVTKTLRYFCAGHFGCYTAEELEHVIGACLSGK